MKIRVWCVVVMAGFLLTAGCGGQYHTEYGPSDSAMMANQPGPVNNVQTASNAQSQPAQISPVAIPFLTIAGMSPGLVKPLEMTAPAAPTLTKPAPFQQPTYTAANNLPTPPEMEQPVTMTKIDPGYSKSQQVPPFVGNNAEPMAPVASQQQLVYPAGGMFMYQAGQTPPANRTPQKYYAPQNQITAQAAPPNPMVDAIIRQAANYKRVYSITSGQFFDPQTKQVIKTIQ